MIEVSILYTEETDPEHLLAVKGALMPLHRKGININRVEHHTSTRVLEMLSVNIDIMDDDDPAEVDNTRRELIEVLDALMPQLRKGIVVLEIIAP